MTNINELPIDDIDTSLKQTERLYLLNCCRDIHEQELNQPLIDPPTYDNYAANPVHKRINWDGVLALAIYLASAATVVGSLAWFFLD